MGVEHENRTVDRERAVALGKQYVQAGRDGDYEDFDKLFIDVLDSREDLRFEELGTSREEVSQLSVNELQAGVQALAQEVQQAIDEGKSLLECEVVFLKHRIHIEGNTLVRRVFLNTR